MQVERLSVVFAHKYFMRANQIIHLRKGARRNCIAYLYTTNFLSAKIISRISDFPFPKGITSTHLKPRTGKIYPITPLSIHFLIPLYYPCIISAIIPYAWDTLSLSTKNERATINSQEELCMHELHSVWLVAWKETAVKTCISTISQTSILKLITSKETNFSSAKIIQPVP